jgi:4-amino-4-deoxy-L-arabinose transferase-like glycosyltransferase
MLLLPFMNISRQTNHIYPWLLLFVISYLSLFHKIDSAPFYMWDESWYALNAQEMLENGKFLEVFLLGKPDLGNSKPPFALWSMIPFIKLFGFNELGVRLASAIFALLSAILLYLIGLKTIRNKWYALALPLVLLSSTGFVNQHIARSGDTDSILAFFILAQSVAFYAYTTRLHQPHAQWYLVATALLLSFGCLTKGIAGLLVLPGLVAWAFYTRTFSYIIKGWGFYVGLILFTILVPGYYWYRNILTPGYIDAVLKFELGGRLEQQTYLNENKLPFYYYFQAFITENRLINWVYVLPIGIVYIFKSNLGAARNLGIFMVFALGGISTLLALSSTKLYWYDASLYPIIACIIGLASALFIQQTKPTYVLLFIVLFLPAYQSIIKNNVYTNMHTSLGNILNEIRNGEHKNDSIYILHSDVTFIVNCYAKKDELKGFSNIVTNHEDPNLTVGKYILTTKKERDVDVNNLFILETITRKEDCAYYKIIAKK